MAKKGTIPWNKGKKYSSPKMKGDKNPNWKGNKVKYVALHQWIRNRKPKPKLCEKCKKNKPIDLANISQKYLRDIKDFMWVCRRCHMIMDNRLKDFIQISKSRKNKKFEEIYGKEKAKSIKIRMGKSQRGLKKPFTKEHIKNIKIAQRKRRKWETMKNKPKKI